MVCETCSNECGHFAISGCTCSYLSLCGVQTGAGEDSGGFFGRPTDGGGKEAPSEPMDTQPYRKLEKVFFLLSPSQENPTPAGIILRYTDSKFPDTNRKIHTPTIEFQLFVNSQATGLKGSVNVDVHVFRHAFWSMPFFTMDTPLKTLGVSMVKKGMHRGKTEALAWSTVRFMTMIQPSDRGRSRWYSCLENNSFLLFISAFSQSVTRMQWKR